MAVTIEETVRTRKREARIATEREASELTLLTQAQLEAVLGKTKMAIWRWRHAPECAHLNFPKPLYINNRPHWKKRDIEAWIAKRPREKT